MLLKVETVEEIGRFKSLKHQAPHFGSLTAIFARNGLGKSTVCSVIRSAADQDARLISARKRLGADKEPSAHLQWHTHGAVTYSVGKWNSCPGPVHVFDGEFVRRNLHVGESVTRDNKRSLIPIVLGEGGVKLADKISQLDIEQRDLLSRISSIEKIIRRTCPVVTDIKAFAQKNVPDNIDQIIDSAKKSLELAKNAVAVKLKQVPTLLPTPDIDDIQALLAETIESLSERAGNVLDEHIKTHAMEPHGTRWIKFGVEHMQGNRCPFCTQDTANVDVVSLFKGYFSEEYSALLKKVDTACDFFKEVYGSHGENLDRFVAKTSLDLNFWSTVCDLSDLPTLPPEDLEAIRQSIIALEIQLDAKKASPLTSFVISDLAEVAGSFAKLQRYQDQISSCVEIISAARSNVADFDVKRAQELLDKNDALRLKNSPPLSTEIADWTACVARRSAIETEKKAAQDALRSYTNSTIGQKQKLINDLLESFGARFQISQTKTNFIGREANVHFCISIGEHHVDAGERQEDKPCFTTVLSAGDKSTLAFSFFLLQVRESTSFSDSTIILDDPFSSQDLDRQWETTSQIRALARDACQVIVLSHDPRFLALIEKNSRGQCSSFQINCTEEGRGSISSWNSADELKELYVRQAERIREYARCGQFLQNVTAESLVKDLRPFLEDYMRARFPGRFAPLIMLDEMTNQVEAVGINDPMYSKISDLRSLNEFSRDHMHGGAALPNPAALRAQCRKVASIIGAY
jgi:wobble nucleotide-excising tRNase